MNLRQPFDNAIAGKLKQLSPPDMEQSWQKMRRLLDEEDGRGAGGKRPPSGGWWKIGLVAVVLLCGSWWLLHTSSNNDQQLASAKTMAGNSESIQPVSTTAANQSNNQPIAQKSTLVSDKDNSNTSHLPQPTAAAANEPIVSRVSVTEKLSSAGTSFPTTTGVVENTGRQTQIATERLLNQSEKQPGFRRTMHAANAGLTKANTQATEEDNMTSKAHPFDIYSGKKKLASHLKTKSTRPDSENTADADDNSAAFAGAAAISGPWRADWSNGSVPDASIVPSDLTANVEAPGNTDEWMTRDLFNKETKLRVARAQRDQAAELADKKERKKLHLDLSNLFKPFSLHANTDPWWSAGLALNSGITVAAQNRFNYNVNAKSGVLLDYLPSPYLQFHINNYVYLQTEINFLTPQYTPQLLVYRSNAELGGQPGYSVEKSAYINKLYYFNWPFSLHYSPISNFYLSAGLQFSSFQSGLATFTSKQYLTASGADHPSSITTETLKFKDDSTAAKIKPNEWRWQVGAEYYINRFSVGMRYNQSLSKSINETVLTSLPPTVNRNQSLLFFIRYNLFDSKHKDNTGAANP